MLRWLSILRRLRRPVADEASNMHTFVCGATRSGKSEAELARLVPLARGNDCAIVLLDPPGTLAEKFLLHLDTQGLTSRVLYDRLADTDRVPGYDWLPSSTNSDPLQREAENDERVREFASLLLRRRGIHDTAATPLIEEGILAALRLHVHQEKPVPLPWLAEAFTLGSPARAHLLAHCTKPDVVRKFHTFASLSPTARRTETGPAERILAAVLESPAFRVRSAGATFDFARLLDERGILILDGRSQGNLSRDAAAVMMGAVLLRVIRHCRTGAGNRVVLVLDEAVNASLVGVNESRALAEAAKWGLSVHVIVQDPFNFPSEEIRRNVLQNCGRHEWFRQGSPDAARLAAEDMAIPLLDPLHVHHTEYRVRTTAAGFDRIQTSGSGEWTDPHGTSTRRSRNWQTVLWPRHREVRDAEPRYMPLTDQVLLMQKEVMLLKPGYRYVRNGKITPVPEYVPMLKDPWPAPGGRQDARATHSGRRFPPMRVERILGALKLRGAYQTPGGQSLPEAPASSRAAASRLTNQAYSGRSSFQGPVPPGSTPRRTAPNSKTGSTTGPRGACHSQRVTRS